MVSVDPYYFNEILNTSNILNEALQCLGCTNSAGKLTHECIWQIQTEYSVEQAKNWSNLPAGAFPDRPGIFLGELSIKQRGIVKAILQKAASENAMRLQNC